MLQKRSGVVIITFCNAQPSIADLRHSLNGPLIAQIFCCQVEPGEETRYVDIERLTFGSLFPTMKDYYGVILIPPNNVDSSKYRK